MPVPPPAPPETAASWQLTRAAEGHATLSFTGSLDVRTAAQIWREFRDPLKKANPRHLEVDAAEVDYCDGAGIALLQFLQMRSLTPRAEVSIRNLRPEFERLLRTFTPQDYAEFKPAPPPKLGQIEELGSMMHERVAEARTQVGFLGSVIRGFAAVLPHRRRLRWREVLHVFEVAGVNALPIVSLISFLVGLIIAFESAGPFKMFGARIFIANMIGIVMARELGPLMTAILLAGRSGSAFAAELGTMKVNEELNALETMGLDPIRFLVVQRVLAGALLTPLLTIYSIGIGIAGGVLVMLLMGFPLVTIYNQMAMSLTMSDLFLGTSKGVVFGIIVALIGCMRGMQTQKGPAAVGDSTTRAVVSGILLVIVADALFSVVVYSLGK